ncbi:MAG: electron transfer flavoprotein beta subunit/FixA family protein [Ancrocorticia sp.]|jgi:electron transfer flavoprotein beta subunit|nr:electron transfer flavoprotein beta subunit/FixA family protein [Ancrocorticia sp.]MCI2002844.1 electron transfer flavoprotein beta subunit/FixA family protein [Ancrocorticia sp.]MCI2013191.1 electron transfer flavoprotein beta subunit/FixA family protein [Ancrocorticia sp.]MCI2028708.1 electron transfer flavoprotein beta subunit/FixA family protein [Ancrocorticia sp.]MCI2177818.1 electron transfer flavoprotein beta subunit/FixA family protein [Ancrocorticia sp.]
MTVVVAYKWAYNPQEASVSSDGQVDWSRAKAAVSADDPVAIQVGRQLADNLATDLVSVSVGTAAAATPMARKAAMSRGIDRGIIATAPDTESWDITTTAQGIAALVHRVPDAQILIAGDAAIDDNAKMAPAIAAGYLGWPCFQNVVGITPREGGWNVIQAVDGGSRTIAVTGPVVCMVTPDAALPHIPGMKDILSAGKKPADVIDASELALASHTISVVSAEKPPARERLKVVFEGPDAPRQLIAALRQESAL